MKTKQNEKHKQNTKTHTLTQNEKFKMITNDTQNTTHTIKKNEQQEPHSAGAPEGLAFNASLVTVAVLRLMDKISSDIHIVLDKSVNTASE